MTELLAGELTGQGPALEVGVGTGQVALPLHEAGVRVVGLDLARPMMDELIKKAGGRAPFPLVQGDATRMPFGDGVFGGAYLRWVLHLIPDWRAALGEIVRVVRPSGVLLAALGDRHGGRRGEIQERVADLAGVLVEPAGLGWADYESLDEAMATHGAVKRPLPRFTEVARDGVAEFVDGLEQGAFSWTWKIDPEVLANVVDQVRRWAEDRWGPLAAIPRDAYEVVWVAYDLPG